MNEIRSTHAIDLPIFYPSVHCIAPDDAIDEEVPGIGSGLGLALIFADSKDDLPPRGRAVIRLGRPDRATSHFERLSS